MSYFLFLVLLPFRLLRFISVLNISHMLSFHVAAATVSPPLPLMGCARVPSDPVNFVVAPPRKKALACGLLQPSFLSGLFGGRAFVVRPAPSLWLSRGGGGVCRC